MEETSYLGEGGENIGLEECMELSITAFLRLACIFEKTTTSRVTNVLGLWVITSRVYNILY